MIITREHESSFPNVEMILVDVITTRIAVECVRSLLARVPDHDSWVTVVDVEIMTCTPPVVCVWTLLSSNLVFRALPVHAARRQHGGSHSCSDLCLTSSGVALYKRQNMLFGSCFSLDFCTVTLLCPLFFLLLALPAVGFALLPAVGFPL